MENSYKVLEQQIFKNGDFKIVPIRMQDRHLIREWRNDQIYHLRQKELLTENDQDRYFNEVVLKLFDNKQPDQILFSYLRNNNCIGYGGLVHINWLDKNAEVSFVMSTSLEKNEFELHWINFLQLIEKVGAELRLHKIYTYAFDVRPRLYKALKEADFKQEAVLKEHCFFQKKFIDVLIHSKILRKKERLFFREAQQQDAELLYQWVNESEVRKNSLSGSDIKWENHISWFNKKISDHGTHIFIFFWDDEPVGQVRLEWDDSWFIDYSVDKKFRGRGLGTKMIRQLIQLKNFKNFTAIVKKENIVSIKVFEKLGFQGKRYKDQEKELIKFNLVK